MTSLNAIAEAFAAWTSIEAQLSGTDDDTFNRLSADMAQIECTAVLLLVQTAQDVFQLLTMTTDDAREPTEAADALFRRARVETARRAGDTQATVFAAGLAVDAKLDGTDDATFARLVDEMKHLEEAASALPVVDALDMWRKVVMSLVWSDYAHPAAALVQEARAALGIAPTVHGQRQSAARPVR